MKYDRWFLILAVVLAVVPIAITLCVYSSLPAEIVMQWGFDGSVDYREKAQLIMMSALPVILLPVMLISPKIDPKRNNYKNFGAAYQSFVIVMLLFLIEMTCIVISEALFPGKISIYSVVTISLGLLFVFLGNMMPKVKSNHFVGIRTPWTRSDPDVWFKTNRLGGYMMFTAGIIICFIPFFLPETVGFIVMVALIFIAAIIPSVMSYIWYHYSEKDND